MMSFNASPTLLPRVESAENLGMAKLNGQRRRSSALSMSLLTVDPGLREGYEVIERRGSKSSRAGSQASARVIHTSPPEDDPVVCVVGVGFVGEILLREFGSVFPSIGFDISEARLADLRPSFKSLRNVRLSSSPDVLSEATHFCISVPTLLGSNRSVNTDHLVKAISTVTSRARPGSTIVIESSVSVGMTRALLGPYANKFHCGMSPERVDPGRTLPAPRDIPKIISALSEVALVSMHRTYSQAFATVVPVSTPEVAEMVKLYENCYRMINIAYANEIANACKVQGIDVDEVISAAATKPFGFQSFNPGLGVGGHCIPVNPFYLMANNDLPLLRRATEDTWVRPRILAKEFFEKSKQIGRAPRALVVGVGFKPGQRVVDFSPAVSFLEELDSLGCQLAFYDPLVEQETLPLVRKLSDEEFNEQDVDTSFDAVAICIKQENVDWLVIKNLQKAFVQWY